MRDKETEVMRFLPPDAGMRFSRVLFSCGKRRHCVLNGILGLFSVLMNFANADGAEAFFPIGAYSPEPKNEENILAVKKAGFNTLLTYRTSPEEMELLLPLAVKHEMKIFVFLHRDFVLKNDLEGMQTMVRRYRNHPAIAAWYLYDEPAGKITDEVLRPFYRMLKEETPHLPVAIVNCWDETWNRYSSVLDWQMIDVYPVHDQDFPYAPLQYQTTFVRQAVKLGKPVIPVLQTMNWKGFPELLSKRRYNQNALRFPNSAELRYMAFGSMVNGIRGIFAYSYFHAMRVDPRWWGNVCSEVFNEVRNFADTVKDPSRPHGFRRAEDGSYMAAVWDNRLLVVVNAWPLARRFSGIWCENHFQREYTLVPWGNTRDVKGEIVRSRIRADMVLQPWEVMIWELQENSSLPGLKQKN